MAIRTGDGSVTMTYELIGDSYERVYPCVCGETHRGDYAFYDFGQHTCHHQQTLVEATPGLVICPACGMQWAYGGEGDE